MSPTKLGRNLDRAIDRLERLQRRRQGEAVPPPVRVRLTRRKWVPLRWEVRVFAKRSQHLLLYQRFKKSRFAFRSGFGRYIKTAMANSFFFFPHLENSVLPSVSVGTPLQVAGRNFQLRTTRKTLRSAIAPALSRIRGPLTCPSVPMMKLTLIRLRSLGVKSGSGAMRAWGGSTSSHREALVWISRKW
jgi:hypothetical protein